jgi:hypothetical protein
MHDTFTKGRKALPNVSYLAPDGFAQATGVPTDLYCHRRRSGKAKLMSLRSTAFA